MAYQPAIRPDPFSYDPPDEPRNDLRSDDSEDQDPSQVLAELARTLAHYGGGNSSADLALDLVLNEIVQQACLATTATGAAAALITNGELVVRATTGVNAPELGVRLSRHAGLSGACMETAEVQLCEDAQADSRVDPLTCAELRIQSILAVAIVDAEEVLGILEIFSSRAHAFGDRDQQTLQALARRIVNTLRTPAPPEQALPDTLEQVSEEATPTSAALTHGPEDSANITAVPPSHRSPGRRDYPTLILTILVIGVALLLGWMFGRPRWQAEPSTNPPASAEPAQKRDLPAQTVPAESATQAKPAERKAASKSSEVPPGPGIVVYDKGKVIFEAGSPKQSAPAIPKISSAIAGGLVITKIRPDYPEQAQQQQIEGAVNLEITVGDTGTVQDVKVASGEPLLANAAAAAVRRWRFRPYAPQGKATAFRTSVTVKFSLSGNDSEAKNP
jgi:TonB family protein